MSARKDEQEQLFLSVLERMTPRKEYVELFRASVMDVWGERKKESSSRVRELDRRVAEPEHKRDQPETAFLFDKSIAKDTYERQHDKLQQEIALAEMARHEQRLEIVDIEGLLAFAERILLSPARQWQTFSLEQRHRLQALLFPEGMTYKDGRLGTARTCVVFEFLSGSDTPTESLVVPTGFEPVSPG